MIEADTFTKAALEHAQDAVTDLVLRAELMGLSLLGEAIRVRMGKTVRTMETDGRVIWVGESWLETNGLRGNTFDLLHEWLHCFCNHVARCGDRDKKLWNTACDIVVVRMASEILSRANDPWPFPPDGVIPPPWSSDLSAEEIYDKLKQDQQLATASRPKPGNGEHQNSDDFCYDSAAAMTEEEEQDFHQKFTSELAQAQLIMEMSTSKTVEQRYGTRVASRLQEVLKGNIPWGRLLRGDLIDAVTKEWATWSPPKRKYFTFLIMPSYHSYKERKLLLGIDVSTSVGPDMKKVFISNCMPAALRAKETIIVTFDQVIREVIVTRRPKSVLEQVQFLSGSHSYTDVRPVFELVNKYKPSATAILTDAYLSYPERKYPSTLWAVPKNTGRPPWGKIYIMEKSW